ncbi:hypothetical protein N7495_005336 [Penicillium taxi]|uniref:uncharacterized protein n=1 Tax=Penicillium taxi TaxID=168475 RepID=UPI00254599F9|nr:uncharacterized protein N7495_005336 [Penicillium taxi]KAJ5893645.1 hypothetical protein N7495_005336 [Penicillium taxi]
MAPKPPPQTANHSEHSAPDLEIVGSSFAIQPSGFTRGPETKDAPITEPITEKYFVQNMASFSEDPLDFLREVSLYMSGTEWRAYNDVIGEPIFYSGFSDHMKELIHASPMLKGRIKEFASIRVGVEEKELAALILAQKGTTFGEKKAHRQHELESHLRDVVDIMLDKMICKMESKVFIRGAYYICTQLLTRAYQEGIHVSSEEVLHLRSVAKIATKKKQSIVFLPCHKSHVDYVSLQLICYRLGIGLPVVVAGDNLNIPGVGAFLQHAGAMWIRRSFGDDQLYHTVVQAYVDTLLQRGFNFECFIEGGRSRTGKLLTPKLGILSFIVDSVLSGRTEDTIICPVSTQYDKVIETESYVSELLGRPKKKERLVDFVKSSSVLSLKLGRVDVRFHKPWSLREYLNQQLTRLDKPTSGPNQKLSSIERGHILRTLGYRVLSEINEVAVMMPTALVGTVILTLRGRGVGKAELVRRLDWLCDRVRAKGGRVAHFYRLSTEEVVDRALAALGPKLVAAIPGLAETTYSAADRFQLSFYRNMLIHLFIPEALVSVAMYAKIKQGGGPVNQRTTFESLRKQVAFLSKLFRGEFIFPTEGLTANLDKTLRGLEADDVIKVTRDDSGTPQHVELSDAERLCGRENFDFYCFLIWPFIDAVWLGAVSLMGLTPPTDLPDVWIDMKKAQDSAQLLGKTLYHQGDISYFEAVNKETLKNSYLQFEEEGIISVAKDQEFRPTPSLKIADGWIPERDVETGKVLDRGRLWDFTELIAMCRREGKNRRDGATVSTRVLALSEAVGRLLFLNATAEKSAHAVFPKQTRLQASEKTSKL